MTSSHSSNTHTHSASADCQHTGSRARRQQTPYTQNTQQHSISTRRQQSATQPTSTSTRYTQLGVDLTALVHARAATAILKPHTGKAHHLLLLLPPQPQLIFYYYTQQLLLDCYPCRICYSTHIPPLRPHTTCSKPRSFLILRRCSSLRSSP